MCVLKDKKVLAIESLSRPNNNIGIADAGLKVAITRKRKALIEVVKDKSVSYTILTNEMGVAPSSVKNFLSGKSLHSKTASKVYDFLVGLDKDKIEELKSYGDNSDFNGKAKQECRNAFIDLIKEEGLNSGKFFVLPSPTAKFEIQLNDEFLNDFHYLACECEKNHFLSLLQTIAKEHLYMSANHCYSNEYTSNLGTDTLTHLYLDYCRTFTTHEEEVKHVLTNNLVNVGGFVAFTFAYRKDSKSFKLGKTILDNMNDDNLNASLTELGIRAKLKEYGGKRYKVTYTKSYRDSTTMLFIVLKRIK